MTPMKKGMLLLIFMLPVAAINAAVHQSEDIVENTAPLVSPALITEAGWTQNWQIDLPVKKGEKLSRVTVVGPHLFVLTDTNVLFCVNRDTGRLRFARQISTQQLPVHKPLYHDAKLWFVIGSEMLVFDPSIGEITLRQSFERLDTGISSGLARNEKYIYVSGSDNRLHAINVDGYWRQFNATADNDSGIVSIIATDDIVVFATRAGNVVGMAPDKPEKQWQFDVTGEIKGHLVQDANDVYVGSYDSKLYKLGLQSGLLEWKTPFHSGAPIRDSFTVGGNLVYVYNALNGLYGVNKQTGQAVWQAVSGQGMICETDKKGFVFALPGILKVMDNVSGGEMYSVNVAAVDLYAHNTTDSVMYLADSQGRVVSVSVE